MTFDLCFVVIFFFFLNSKKKRFVSVLPFKLRSECFSVVGILQGFPLTELT